MLKSKRNGQLAKIISESADKVVLEYDDGKVKEITKSTMKRWWEVIEEEAPIEEVQSEVIEEEPQEETPASEPEKSEIAPEKVKKESKGKSTKKDDKKESKGKESKGKELPHPLKKFIIDEAINRGCQVSNGKVETLVSIKLENGAALAFTFSSKNVKLWLREIVAKKVLKAYDSTNHAFGARIKYMADNKENRDTIIALIEESIKFQKGKQDKKTTKTKK